MASKDSHHGDVDPVPVVRKPLNPIQQHLVAASGEFVGTFFFLYLAYAGNIMAVTQAPSSAAGGGTSSLTLLIISMVYGFSLLVNVWAFYRISGGLFNPAVTLGLSVSGQLPWLRAAFLIPVQLVASMCAGGLVSCMYPVDIAIANSVLSPQTSIAQGLFLEMFFTAELVFVVLMLAVEKSKDTFLAPVGIGMALFSTMLAGTQFTGGSLNPARSFGCAVAARSFPRYHWIYWLGPVLGACLAAAYYRFVRHIHYESANPGQDASSVAAADAAVRRHTRSSEGPVV